MPTLTYGIRIPSTNDAASSWMDDISDNFTRIDAHSHNGTDSPSLTTTSFTHLTSTVSASGWTDNSGGNFSKVVTVPTDITEINNFLLKIYITASGIQIFPGIERVTATTFRIRANSQLALSITYA